MRSSSADSPAWRPVILAVILPALLFAVLLGSFHYATMVRVSGPTFSFDGVSPQERVNRAHLRRAVPIVSGVSGSVAAMAAFALVRRRASGTWWLLAGPLAGGLGFLAAEPFVPRTGPFAGAGASAEELWITSIAGSVAGLVVGVVFFAVWHRFVRAGQPGPVLKESNAV